MSAPTPARSEMVEKVCELLHDGFRDPGDYESNDPPGAGETLRRYDRRVALSLIAAVLDNLPWEVMARAYRDACVPDRMMAAIAAARRSVLGHEETGK